MNLSEFIRVYPLRSKNIAWFFGAGTSVAAGLPTAWDLTWEFKRRIFCSEEGYNLNLFHNLSDSAIRNQIQSYFDSKDNYPAENSSDEYSFFFEKAFPYAIDRSTYLTQQLQSVQNSYGHKVLGVLMKNNLITLIFTTNFDKAFENSAIDQLKSMDKFFIATLDNTETSLQKYHSGFRPFICKLHGDYFSEKLKNTSDELQKQDVTLRDILYHACLSNGLGIMGYSGRDRSIMEIFNKALDQYSSFANGIFWFHKIDSQILPEVEMFINKARQKGVQAELIKIETFDTVWADIVKGIPNLPADDLNNLNVNYFKKANVKLPPEGKNYPIIRFNAIKVTALPTNARLIKCNAGNTKEINELIKNSNADLIAIRKKEGVVGFGSDNTFANLFSQYGPLEKDIFQIPDSSLNNDDSSLKGLLTQALLKALVLNTSLLEIKRRERYIIIPNPKLLHNAVFQNLNKELNNSLQGTIPKTKISWIVALEISLQKKFSNYLMIVSPTVIAGKNPSDTERLQIAPFIKEFTARWYNAKYTQILDAWLDVIFCNQHHIKISSFRKDIIGFNANFKLIRESAFVKSL